jgi:hypothetical protein
MKESILEKNIINVSDVEKPSRVLLTLKSMKQLTLERNLMYVSSVAPPS